MRLFASLAIAAIAVTAATSTNPKTVQVVTPQEQRVQAILERVKGMEGQLKSCENVADCLIKRAKVHRLARIVYQLDGISGNDKLPIIKKLLDYDRQ
jgi:hypothetical protein